MKLASAVLALASAASVAVAAADSDPVDVSDSAARRLVAGQANFVGPSETACLPDEAEPCDDFSTIAIPPDDATVIPCGSCVRMDVVGDLDLPHGLDVHGKLIFEDDGTTVNITAPFVFVQGILQVESSAEIRPENRRVTFHLTGTDNHALYPIDSNADKCGGGGCDMGKKPFVVAGGRVDVRAFPTNGSGGDCPAWSRLRDFAAGGVAQLASDQFESPASPPGGCGPHIFDQSFDGGYDDDDSWTQGEGTSAGATCAADSNSSAMVVTDRLRDYQGPTIDLTQHRACFVPNVDYLFTARVRLTKESEEDGAPTACKSSGSNCLRLENWIMYHNDTESELTPYAGSQTQSTAGKYGEFVDFTATFQFDEEDLHEDNVYNALVLLGPEEGVNISLQHAKLTLPDPSSYPDPNNVCHDLVTNGNAEGNGIHPHPAQVSSSSSRALVLEEDGNKFYRHVDRSSRFTSLEFPVEPNCVAKNQVYLMSARVRVHSPTPVAYEFELRRCDAANCEPNEDFDLLKCPAQSIGDGWVTCSGEVAFPEAMEGGVSYHLRYQLNDQDVDEETSDVDLDDVHLTFVQGPIEGVIVPDDVSQCWGSGSEVLVTSHTLDWDVHQVAVVDSVEALTGGMSKVKLTDSIVPATTEVGPVGQMAAEVALLTRNVGIEGAADDPANPKHGGYFQVYHTPDVDQTLVGVEFKNMGQQGLADRFAVHMHRCKSLPGSSISKNAIVNSYQRCIVLQDVQGMTVEGNVAYKTEGHCYMTMDGAETENRFISNLGAHTDRNAKRLPGSSDWYEQSYPTTFYMRGPGNYYEGNVAAGSYRYGFWFHIYNKVKDESDPDYSDNPRKAAFRSFINNVAHSNRYDGFRFQDLNRDDKTLHSDLVNTKAYRNRDRGFYAYYAFSFAIKGGFFADNRYGIDLYRSAGISEISNVTIHGETSMQRDLVDTQDARYLDCSTTYPVMGMQMVTYRRYSGYFPTTEFKNIHFSDFDQVSRCTGSVAMYFRDDREDEHFDFETSFTNVTVDDSRAYQLYACKAAGKNINDVLMTDMDGSFNPDSESTFSGTASIVSNQPWMKAFGTCTDYPEQCISYCENTCLRTVSFFTEFFGTEDWTMRVSEVNGTRSFDVPSNYYNKYDAQVRSDYWRLRRFSASLPAGTYKAEFFDGDGKLAWPTFAEESWTPAPSCTGHAKPGDIVLEYPDLAPGECDELLGNADLEGATWGEWHKVGGALEIATGMGMNASTALKHKGRSRTSYGVGQYVDTRCILNNTLKQYEFKAWVKLMSGTTEASCDPNENGHANGCPMVTMRLRYYKDKTKKDSFSNTYPSRKAEVVRPYDSSGWNLLHGVFTWDEDKGLPIEDKASIFLYVNNFGKNKDLIIDNASLAPADATCDELVRNGDFATGTSQYWDTYGTTVKLEMVEGIDGTGDFAIKAYARDRVDRTQKQYIKINCLVAGELYLFQAKYKIENGAGIVACNPESTVAAERCPEAMMKSYRRTESDTTDYSNENGYRNFGNPVSPTNATGWSTIAGVYMATAHEQIAEYLELYFDDLDPQYNFTVDNVSITPFPKTCRNLVVNPTFEDGTAAFWRMTDRNKGKIDVVPGAGTSLHAARVYDRTSRSYGIRTDLDYRCFEYGQRWEISAKFRLFNATGGGVGCEINNRNDNSDQNCPAVYLSAKRCNGENEWIRFWNEIVGAEWDPENFNDFYAEFPVGSNFETCTEVYVYVSQVNPDWDIVIDDFSVTMKTDAPTSAPIAMPTAVPTLKPTSSPTQDGTSAPTEAPTNAPTLTATDCPPTGTKQTLSIGGAHSLSIVGPGKLCTLTKTSNAGNVTSVVPIARSYDGHDWDNAAGENANTLLSGQTWKCYSSACEIELPALNSNEEYVLTSYNHSLPPKDEVARFLESTTFGTTQNDLDSWDYTSSMDVSMAAWVEDQIDLAKTPMTSHREYWRRRSNPRWTFPQQVAQSNHPCAPNSRWRRFTFTVKDRYLNNYNHFFGVSSVNSNNETKYILSVDGQDRTVVAAIGLDDAAYANYTFNSSFPYEICSSPHHYVGGELKVRIESGSCKKIAGGNPAVDFSGFESYAQRVVPLPDISEFAPVDELISQGDEYILANSINDSSCTGIGIIDDSDPPVLGKLLDGSWLYFDPRLALEENTASGPIADGGGATEFATAGDTLCSNAPRTFLNFDGCVLSTEGSTCGDVATPVTEIPLDDENIQTLHRLTGRYVYGILGLVVKQMNMNSSTVTYEVAHPCTPGGRSRWVKNAGATCPNPTTLQPTTNASLFELILERGEDDKNPVIRDIFFPTSGTTCDAIDMDVKMQIQVGDDCWTHVHPEYLSVYDMTYWTLDHTHPGNMHAAADGDYNPIKKWMDLKNSSTLTFPSTYPENPFGEGNHSDHMDGMEGNHSEEEEMHIHHHPMSRWEMHSVKFTYVGRMYDLIRFRDLPNELRLDEVASYYNATGDVGGEGVLVCGSPGEVSNDPSLGSGFDVASNSNTDTTAVSAFERQRETTWMMAALTGLDQLRQRMAWALSQILVVVKSAIVEPSRNTEIFLNYYDIFVRNAFGNYRDILREISYSAMMAENLSYLQSKSHAYMREQFSKLTFADENFAREIMQLFTIGMEKLNIDGTPKLDSNGKNIPTYTNEDIMNFARVWTGFDYQKHRGNTEDTERSKNRLDPMRIEAKWRDRFPKRHLNGGYIGDQYPLCVDLPEKMFLRKGARYRLLGSSSLPELMDADPKYLDDPTIQKFELDENSHLKELLCSGDCSSPTQTEITLDTNLDCEGNECLVDTVRVVQVAPGMHFEYVRPPCVELAFYDNAKKLNRRKRSDAGTICGNPLLPVAMEACCIDQFELEPVAVMNNTYDGERVTYSSASSRCAESPLCDFDEIDNSIASHKTGYHWTTDGCEIQIKVDVDGRIAIVHQVFAYTAKAMHVDDDTLNFFHVVWNGDGDNYPTEENSCGGSGDCTVLPEGGCKCDTTVSESRVFSNMPLSIEEVLSSLYIGSMDPATFDATYSDETDLSTGIIVHKKSGQGIDIDSIFEVTDSTGRKHFLRNVRSTVTVAGTSFTFRNTPHFMSFIPTETDIRDAQYETEAALDHYFYQDNTAPFLAIRFIQRFGVSNPTPRYVKSVATAFRTGIFVSSGKTFGAGKYGDLAATIAAVLLLPEARTVVLDADPAHGSLREPLLKIIALMRNMDFATEQSNTLLEFNSLENEIGQMAYEFPTVFSFFLPEYVPSGPCTAASLVSPEAMLLDMPKIVATLNGIFSMVKYGLEDKYNGFSIARNPVGYLTYDSSGKTPKQVVDELASLLTSGRLSAENRQIVEEAYNETINTESPDDARHMAQQLIASSAEFHSTNLVKKRGEARDVVDRSGSGGGSYKAVVYLMFAGGCDSYNMLVPHTCAKVGNETDLNEQYVEIREEVALTKQNLLVINATNQPCEKFGIHTSLPILKQLYDDNDAIFIANAGVLTKPVNKGNYRDETVTQLFAHNTMQREAKRVDPFEVYSGTGILGRMGDVLHRNNVRTSAISIDSSSVALVGKPGESPAANIISRNGIDEFNHDATTSAAHMREKIEAINDRTTDDSGFMAETWSSLLHESLASNEQLKEALDNANVTASFPTSSLGKQLELVSKLIQTAETRGISSDMYYLQMGGYDTHSNVESNLRDRFDTVNAAIDAFVGELKSQGLWENVVLVQTSDFGRTLTPNSGQGTDHAWGGNYFMIGGDLNGGHVVGKYPSDISDGAELNVGRGRMIPTTSWDHLWNGVAQWMGIENEADLIEVCPNRGNFNASKLFTDADLFNSANERTRGRERKMYLRK